MQDQSIIEVINVYSSFISVHPQDIWYLFSLAISPQAIKDLGRYLKQTKSY